VNSEKAKKEVIEIVDELIELRKNNHFQEDQKTKTLYLGCLNRLNEKIYSLYQITPEEIQIIESNL